MRRHIARRGSPVLAVLVVAVGALAGGAAESVGTGPVTDPSRWLADAEQRRKEFVRLPSKSERALADAAGWLVRHQDEDGHWSAEEFAGRCTDEPACGGAGLSHFDVGVTALAALALMASSDMRGEGEERAAVERGLRWLVSQQKGAEGLIGPKVGHSFLYGHAIATTALGEGRVVLGLEELDEPLERAIACVRKGRNPYAVWRYGLPPVGDNDTSVSAWMVIALATARDAGVPLDEQIVKDAVRWIDEVTDRKTGRIGYDAMGSASSRVPGVNGHFPTNLAEGMTGAGMLVRLLCGQDPAQETFIARHAELILARPPDWGSDGRGADLYAWYHSTAALHQLGGKPWKAWSKQLVDTLSDHQERRGEAKGSWPPVGPWGWAGGRVYSTAVAALTLAAPVRHQKLFED